MTRGGQGQVKGQVGKYVKGGHEVTRKMRLQQQRPGVVELQGRGLVRNALLQDVRQTTLQQAVSKEVSVTAAVGLELFIGLDERDSILDVPAFLEAAAEVRPKVLPSP